MLLLINLTKDCQSSAKSYLPPPGVEPANNACHKRAIFPKVVLNFNKKVKLK